MPKIIEESISISPARKMGFISLPEEEAKEGEDNDVEIVEENLKHALHGDIVKVEILDKKIEDKLQGKVTEIVKRAKMKYVGIVEKKKNSCFILPDSKKMYVDIYLPESECSKVDNDLKVYVEIEEWKEDRDNPTGKILEILGKKGDHEVEIQSIILEKGIETDFPKVVDAEAKEWLDKWPEIIKEELSNRRDFRDTLTMTIDPEDAKDFDDALSIKTLENGNYEIGIHIADVSYFVRPGTELDKEGFERAFSTYLVDRTIPMLPEILSNDLCSLNPGVERLAFSAVFEINKNAEVQSQWFGQTVIKSDKRFSYQDAEDVLNAGSGENYAELKIFSDLSKILKEKKLDAGALKFAREEFEFELDDNKVPIKINKKPVLSTYGLIEEFMLLANRHVAKYIHDACKKGDNNVCGLMYRVHNVPDGDKIQELSVFLKALGYILPIDKEGNVSAQDFNAVLKQAEGKAEEALVTRSAIKTMSKAIYSVDNAGHFGLAFEYYTHFTSPIRRYPDLVVHRILNTLLKDDKIGSKDASFFAKVADHSSQQEVNAQTAERESIRFKQVEFMQSHIGSEYEGIISGVAPFGLFVVLDGTGAEGLVHISNLGEDYYELDEKNYRIVGRDNGGKFTLGDKVKVRIESADLDNRKLDLKLA